jgi:hypothetical protein
LCAILWTVYICTDVRLGTTRSLLHLPQYPSIRIQAPLQLAVDGGPSVSVPVPGIFITYTVLWYPRVPGPSPSTPRGNHTPESQRGRTTTTAHPVALHALGGQHSCIGIGGYCSCTLLRTLLYIQQTCLQSHRMEGAGAARTRVASTSLALDLDTSYGVELLSRIRGPGKWKSVDGGGWVWTLSSWRMPCAATHFVEAYEDMKSIIPGLGPAPILHDRRILFLALAEQSFHIPQYITSFQAILLRISRGLVPETAQLG